MLDALGLGLLAQSSLLLAGVLACRVTIPRRVTGFLAGFGAGALISAVSFDLVAEAEVLPPSEFSLWMLIGVATFLGGDWVVERRFGSEGDGGSMGIVVGSVVDGVPESVIFGIQLATGFPVSPSFLGAVFVSNVPQAIAPSADLAESGWDGIDIRPVDVDCAMTEADHRRYITRLGPLGRVFGTLEPEVQARVRDAMHAAFAPFTRDGEVRFTAACWMIER